MVHAETKFLVVDASGIAIVPGDRIGGSNLSTSLANCPSLYDINSEGGCWHASFRMAILRSLAHFARFSERG